MDFKGITPAKLSRAKVQEIAEEFRESYVHNEDIPVDIELIMQSALGIQPIPEDNLQSLFNIEGFISKDFKYIYIDNNLYKTDKYYKRIRFTFAHEIGHYILHRKEIEMLKLQSEQEWIDLLINIPEDYLNWFEWQAKEFAGRLLVPVDRLVVEFKSSREQVLKSYRSWNAPPIDNAELFELVSPIIAQKFDVSKDVIEIRLDREDIMKYITG